MINKFYLVIPAAPVAGPMLGSVQRFDFLEGAGGAKEGAKAIAEKAPITGGYAIMESILVTQSTVELKEATALTKEDLEQIRKAALPADTK